MSRISEPKSWRELIARLRDLGAVPVRCRGSHQVWRFADGTTFVAVINHLGRAVDANILVRFRRLCDGRRTSVSPRPPPPG